MTVEAPRDYTDAFTFSVLAKCFTEREYLKFVKNGKWFIYKSGSSEKTAKANITKLNDMIYRYFNYNIPIEVQLNVSNRRISMSLYSIALNLITMIALCRNILIFIKAICMVRAIKSGQSIRCPAINVMKYGRINRNVLFSTRYAKAQ